MGEKKFNPRSLWTPKRPELKEQCASCPFRDGNDAEFGEVVAKLSKAEGSPIEEPGLKFKLRLMTDLARDEIRRETNLMGDFSCHLTVYNDDMSIKDDREWRQCPGASKHHKEAGCRS